MTSFRPKVFCLGLFVAAVYSAAVPTQDTIVVARSDDVESTESSSAATELTTEEPNAPIKLTKMSVQSEIALRYAHTAVVTHVRNPAKRAQEATFRVLLPETAFISGFVMTLDGKSYKAYVKEKEEAKQIYNDAVSQGLGAAHVTAKARDSNHFTVSVNVEPNTTAVFNLTYEELLVRRNGVYNHAINLHPGALVPEMKVVVHIKETQKITQLRVPEVRTGNEVDATDEDAQNSQALIERKNKDREATITFSPDINEQKRLMEIYAAKTKESAGHHTGWYNREEEDDEVKKEGMLGQFIVQYDVDRSKNGEILVNDGYFVHFLAPSSLPPLKKHVVFVLDTSGSMMGRKVEQLRDAMKTILAKLNPGDYFNIVEFDSTVQVHDLKEANEPSEPKRAYYYEETNSKPLTLFAPSPATPENIEKAQIIVSRLQASGGTNIYSALEVAINLIRNGKDGPSKAPPVVVDKPHAEPNSDVGETHDEPKSGAGETAAEASTTVTAAVTTTIAPENNKDDKEDHLEPIIIFLTDGDPTVGETDTGRIISHLTEKNSGHRRASLFSLAFGEDADRKFLRKLSLRNEGFMRHIYEAADAALQLRDFYRQVSSPLLADVKFIYPVDQIKEGSVTRHKFRAVYDGSEAVVAGQVADDVTEMTPHVLGFCGVDDGVGRKRYELSPKVPVSRVKSEYLPLERLWAYLTVKQLLDEKDASDSDQKAENSPEKKALKIALQYEFVTALTSLVVVKPNATKAVDAESVDDHGVPQYTPLSASLSKPMSLSGVGYADFAAPQYSFASQSYSAPVVPLSLETEQLFEAEDVDLSDRMAFYPVRSYHDISGFARPIGHIKGGINLRSQYDPDDYDASTFYVPTTTYAPKTTNAPTTTPTPALPSSPLAAYHLDRCSWAEQSLNTTLDALVLHINGTEINLKLSKDNNAPKSEGGDVACPTATDGAAGLCVYLTRCDAAADITSDVYTSLYCTVSDGFAGICCPANKVDTQTATN